MVVTLSRLHLRSCDESLIDNKIDIAPEARHFGGRMRVISNQIIIERIGLMDLRVMNSYSR